MKIDALLFLQRSDITHHARAGRDQAHLPLLFIDPGLAEYAIDQGLDPDRFSYRPLSVGPHFQARIAEEATTRAAAIDQELCRERERLFGPHVLAGWDHEPMRLFFMRALVARDLGAVCDRTFPEARIGLYRPSNPQLFYFDSYLSTDLFVGASTRWHLAAEYEGAAHWRADHSDHCFDFAEVARAASAGAQAVTHIPTCYWHHEQFSRQITERFVSNIDLPSAFWDIPIRRTGSMLCPIDALPSDHISDRARAYRDVAGRIFDQHLGQLALGREALHRQSDALAARSFVQAINYEGLIDALRGSRPHLVVTDHDTGSNGPLFSVAARLGSSITVLPHASYPAFTLPHAMRVQAIERDGFATPVRSAWGQRVATRSVQLGSRASPVARTRVQTVCLVLNTLSSQGISHIDLAGAARFHMALKQLCQQHGVQLLVRLKPNAAGVMMASPAFGLAATALQAVLDTPLADLAARTDLCVAYGEPTTAGYEFLASGSYLMQANDQLWPCDYVISPPLVNDGLVPSFDTASALSHLASLVSDSDRFAAHAQHQRQDFCRRLTAADDRIFDTP